MADQNEIERLEKIIYDLMQSYNAATHEEAVRAATEVYQRVEKRMEEA